jgi:hypothetical protein
MSFSAACKARTYPTAEFSRRNFSPWDFFFAR